MQLSNQLIMWQQHNAYNKLHIQVKSFTYETEDK